MPSYDYDLFVIGGGSAGIRAAWTSASLGARVGLVEDRPLGGTCVNLGCVPKKLYSYGASYPDAIADAAGFGWQTTEPTLDWPTLVRHTATEVARNNRALAHVLDHHGVEHVHGRGTVVDPHTVRVGDRVVSTHHIAIATGGHPWLPDFPGREHVITSDQVFSMPVFPRRIAIVGGGYIASEFASILNGLGAEAHLVYRGELFLRGFDEELRRELATEMRKRGVHLHFECVPSRVEVRGEGYRVHLTDGDTLDVDVVMYAVGRRPNTAGLGLEAAGVELSPSGAVVVDERLRTCIPSIFALGDVIERIQLTPMALAEGMVVAHDLFGAPGRVLSYDNVPTTIFTRPNLSGVGLDEHTARARFPRIRIYKTSFVPLRHRVSGRDARAYMKLVVDDSSDRVLGVHMVGDDAGEVIQGFAVALQCGATKAQFDRTVGIHPTSAEEFVTMRTPWQPS